jgi:hypothetical protein
MNNLNKLDMYRIMTDEVYRMYGGFGDDTYGAFMILFNKTVLRIIASSDDNWDHVSVSTANRVPTWEEMEYIKRLFFRSDEVAMQLHMPIVSHINIHDYCLHLWRPKKRKIPIPPSVMV